MKFVKYLITFFFILVTFSSYAQTMPNSEIPVNEANCKKIKGWSNSYEEGISKTNGISIESLRFRRAAWDGFSCGIVIDSSKGVKTCKVISLLYNNKEKYVFAIPYQGSPYVECN